MCGKDVSDRPTTASPSAAGANGSMLEVERGWGEAADGAGERERKRQEAMIALVVAFGFLRQG